MQFAQTFTVFIFEEPQERYVLSNVNKHTMFSYVWWHQRDEEIDSTSGTTHKQLLARDHIKQIAKYSIALNTRKCVWIKLKWKEQ